MKRHKATCVGSCGNLYSISLAIAAEVCAPFSPLQIPFNILADLVFVMGIEEFPLKPIRKAYFTTAS